MKPVDLINAVSCLTGRHATLLRSKITPKSQAPEDRLFTGFEVFETRKHRAEKHNYCMGTVWMYLELFGYQWYLLSTFYFVQISVRNSRLRSRTCCQRRRGFESDAQDETVSSRLSVFS